MVDLPVRPSAAWMVDATPSAVPDLRRRAAEFVSGASGSDEVTQAVAMAVSETVTNAVVHAYDGQEPGPVRISCDADDERFVVEVVDEGAGIWLRRDSPGIGHGLALVGALAHGLSINPGPGGRGTAVTMTFDRVAAPAAPPGLEMLCALALETLADVSNVDLVQQGVLRRFAAEVADDAALTAWLRTAVPPAKPRDGDMGGDARGWRPAGRPRPDGSALTGRDGRAPEPRVVGCGRTREARRNARRDLGPRGSRGGTPGTAPGGDQRPQRHRPP